MIVLFRNRNFLLVWLASIADNISLSAILLTQSWYVVNGLHLKAQLGWVMIASSVPRLGLMLFGGVFADRLPKVRIMSTTFALRMLVMLCGAMLFRTHSMTIWALISVAACFGMLDAFFWPSRDAIVPSIVGEADLTRANSVMQATNQVGLMVGPTIAGAMLGWFSFDVVYAFTAVLMAAGAVTIAFVRERGVDPTSHALNRLAALQEGLRYVIGNRVLRTQMSIYVVANLLFTGAVSVGIPIIASEHLNAGARGLSYLQSAYAVGMVSGFMALMRFPPRRKRLALIAILIVVEGGLIALQGSAYSLSFSMALQLLLGFCVACNNVPMLSILQQFTDRDKLGRVMSINSVTSMGLSPLSMAAVSALLAGGASISMIMPAFGLSMSVIVAIMALTSAAVRGTN
jgi:MFS family permease